MNSPDIPSLGMTLGAVYVGATVAAILFGITNLQAFIYYKKHPDDWWLYKYSVASLWILDTLHVALSTHALYHYLIDLFGNFLAIYNIVWSFKLQILFNVLIIMVVQALYTVRLWKLDRNPYKVVLWFVVLTVIIAFSSGIYVVVDVYSLSNFLSMERIRKAIWIAFSAAAISDFAIAFSMCYYLHKSRSVTNFTSTSNKLLNLMRLVVISGLATSVCSLLCLITFFIWPNSFIFIGIDFILPKRENLLQSRLWPITDNIQPVYINSLLSLLNSRKGHKSEHGESRLLRFAPKDCSGDTGEQGVNILLTTTEISDKVKDSRSYEV
ncbi:hypothetical protein EDD18DRAFT_1360420 [Armillaria luteobubalina]|uniref:DUF6534 domain-containing protein n=1 Tax=Armillaria luteobubalina TaxID=153913 RepID=A0AA39PLY4_9AGAR|nr:hypothetical protein EDD18DRAFT_1360420 [Armillaria luteobubalina]